MRKLVCFFLHGRELAAPVDAVPETVGLTPITPVFLMPPCVAGITSLRGEILAVLDVAVLMGMPPCTRDPGTRVVVVEHGDRAAGLLVDGLGSIPEVADDAMGGVYAWRIGKIQHRIARRTKADALMIGRQKCGSPQSRVQRIIGTSGAASGQQNDKTRQILLLAAEAIAEPRPHTGPPGLLMSRLQICHSGIMIDRFRVHRFDETQVVGHRAQLRQQFA